MERAGVGDGGGGDEQQVLFEEIEGWCWDCLMGARLVDDEDLGRVTLGDPGGDETWEVVEENHNTTEQTGLSPPDPPELEHEDDDEHEQEQEQEQEEEKQGLSPPGYQPPTKPDPRVEERP